MGTITKALNLLNHFSASRPEIGLTDFRKLSGQDKATVHRHLVELSANGFLEQNPGTKGYRLGPAILRLAAVRERLFPARTLVAPLVEHLAAELGELVHVSLREGDHLSPLYHHDALIHGTRVYFDEAELLPLHATASGLAMLAFGPEHGCSTDLAEITAESLDTPFHHQSRNELRESVENVRVKTASPSLIRGSRSMSRPSPRPCLRGSPGGNRNHRCSRRRPLRMTEDMKSRIRRDLIRTAADVTERLGGLVPTDLKRIWHHAA